MNDKIIEKVATVFSSLAKGSNRHRTAAIVLAAGKGERIKDSSISKQLFPINGVPVVVHTLLAFEKCRLIDEIIVVTAEKEMPLYAEFKKKYKLSKLKAVTKGGDTRAKSSYCGFCKVSKSCDFVAIHDAVRCLITSEDIENVVKEAYNTGAAIAACRMVDTVKVADENGFIKDSPDRSLLWAAQTPQVFKKTAYEVAIALNQSLEKSVTDDAMLVAKTGQPIKLVEVTCENMKITSKEDFWSVSHIMTKREEKTKS